MASRPGHLSRSQLTVQLDTYSFPIGPIEHYRLWDDKGNLLDSINVWRGKDLITMRSGEGRSQYSVHQLTTLRGITELIEFRRMEPWFYVSDDAASRAKFGVR